MVTSPSCRAGERGHAPSPVLSHLSPFVLVPEDILPPLPFFPADHQSHQKAHQSLLLTSAILTDPHPLWSLESTGVVFPLLSCSVSSHTSTSPLLLGCPRRYWSELRSPSSWVSAPWYPRSAVQPRAKRMFFVVQSISRTLPVSKALCRKCQN